MTQHISARLAWHDSGWTGHICRDPARNTYCVGGFSYPGQQIAEYRDTAWEAAHAGAPCTGLNRMPPCAWSLNAFGCDTLTAWTNPPEFFNDSTRRAEWEVPPSTVCLWPYEEMYSEQVRLPGGHFDPRARFAGAQDYFARVEPERSLIFYYVNYSNPFSEDEQARYVIAGISRVKHVGGVERWRGQSPRARDTWGDYVWARNVTSMYPEEGLRIPYHLYQDRQDILSRICLVPTNPRLFKYGTRQFGDDDALELVEQFIQLTCILEEAGDRSEDWPRRRAWLAALVAELWRNRGLYPGLASVLSYLRLPSAVPLLRQVQPGRDEEVLKDRIFRALEGPQQDLPGIPEAEFRQGLRQWDLQEPEAQRLLRDVLPRFALGVDQVRHILETGRDAVVLQASLADLAGNPYLLAEQYVGVDQDDQISFARIDHGMFPAPHLGAPVTCAPDDPRRFRALCVDRLRNEAQHTFLLADQVLGDINARLQAMGQDRQHTFTMRYFHADRDVLGEALVQREQGGQRYLYRKPVHDDERAVEEALRDLVKRPNIDLGRPVTDAEWRNYLHNPGSPVAKTYPHDYGEAIAKQARVCAQLFRRPLCVLSGAAGTGKTTVVRALLQAIQRAHGAGVSFQLLAPTGKAADRLRQQTGREAATIHAFLTRNGWLYPDNLLPRRNGRRIEGIQTLIIDEASMLELSLLATLMRAINWNSVQRLILVGDVNQLPPIGTGKPFADMVDWLRRDHPDHIGILTGNLRQMEQRAGGKGTALLDLADLYIRVRGTEAAADGEPSDQADEQTRVSEARTQDMLRRVQLGGDVDQDLRVEFWSDGQELADKLVAALEQDMMADTGQTLDPERAYELWKAAYELPYREGQQGTAYHQVLSPYRGDLFGTEHLNAVLPGRRSGALLDRVGSLGGVTFFDKVIQIRNRPRSDLAKAYNTETRRVQEVELFNGDIGFAHVHGYDRGKWRDPGFRIRRFQVAFARKEHLWVDFDSDGEVEENLELAYAISIHKAQGSEFGRVYLIIPKHRRQLLTSELVYTGLTRASRHCTLFLQEDITPLLAVRRPEASALARINSSLFEFRPVPPALLNLAEWYAEGKVHRTLVGFMVRSKSEVIIANLLADREIPFTYETPLYGADGTFYLPDFTLTCRGATWYWEHLGLLQDTGYRAHWDKKKAWYQEHGFATQVIVTTEGQGLDSAELARIIDNLVSGQGTVPVLGHGAP